RLVEFSQTLIGHVRGGLAQVNILSSMLFAGLSGSAVADTSALGSMLIPAMKKNGYTVKFAAAITAASSVIGPIIPPSGIMIIYAYVMEVSVAALFAGGILPGVLVGLGLMAVVGYMARTKDFPAAGEKATWAERGRALWKALLPLMTPVIILGGILGGVFTPTEASAVAAVYALLIGLFVLGTLKLSDLPKVFLKSAMTSSVVLLLVGAAMAFKTMVSLSHVAEDLANWILTLSSNPLVLLFLINILLFIVGMFLDAGPAIIILGPILGPIFVAMGVDPIHFAVIMSVNLTVGLATPPMGLVLFVASSVSNERVETISKAILPFLAVEVLVIFMITYIPSISLAIPRLLGFVQ
ncbi:MAG: TRAP transporter large permease, partial [Alphaproteobacteria bacterium]|nr:TRAP transporter large permease [Alphaproteobacteria bacterium]